MPIDFFDMACKTSSNSLDFGLCDDPPPAENPAYIDEDNAPNWIADVKNEKEKEIDFYAIDRCIEINKPNGGKESSCDGMLQYEENLIFVELKDRASNGWLTKGREQLTNTFLLFAAHHDVNQYQKMEAYVSNKQRPLSNLGNNNQIQQFKDETGLNLKVQKNILIQ